MEITLEKIELVKDRTGISYKEAKEALEKADGSVVDAIIAIEEGIDAGTRASIGDQGAVLFGKIKDLVKKGNVSKIQVKKGGETLINVPVNVGVVGVLVTPIAMIVAVAAAFGFRCVIEVIRDDGSVVELSERVSETTDGLVEKGANIFEDVKTKGADFAGSLKDKVANKNYEEKFEDLVDKAKDFGDAVVDKAKETNIDEMYENVKDKYHDLTDAAKEKIESVKKDDDFILNISEDLEDVADAIEEEMAEELGKIKIVDLTDK